MRNWRVLIAVVAVVLAALAGGLIYQYLRSADKRAARKYDLVPVLVARREVPKGTLGADALKNKLVAVDKVPRKTRPDTALPTKDQTSDDALASLTGKVAVSKIAKGQFVVEGSFVEPSKVEGFSATVPAGKVAMALSVDSAHAAGGFIVPGDTVNVLLSVPAGVTKHDVDAGTALDNPNGPKKLTGFLLPGIKVLAVGATTEQTTSESGTPAGNTGGGLITLLVDPRQAEQLSHATYVGGVVTLVLNPPGFDPTKFTVPQEVVDQWNLWDQPLSTVTEARDRAPRGTISVGQ